MLFLFLSALAASCDSLLALSIFFTYFLYTSTYIPTDQQPTAKNKFTVEIVGNRIEPPPVLARTRWTCKPFEKLPGTVELII